MQILVKQGMKDDIYGNCRSSEGGKKLMRSTDWVRGYWEHIAPQPIYIRDKYHLKEVCQKHGVIPKAFAKRSSQGKGLEWSF